jgi:hypothetical protein
VHERTIVIIGTFVLFLVSSAIVTYEQIQIGNLQGELRHMKILMKAGVGQPSSPPATEKKAGTASFESDTVSTAMKIQDFSSILPPMVSQGRVMRLTHRSQVRFVEYHLVVFELQDPKGQTVPVLYSVEDPNTFISWRYLYSFSK